MLVCVKAPGLMMTKRDSVALRACTLPISSCSALLWQVEQLVALGARRSPRASTSISP